MPVRSPGVAEAGADGWPTAPLVEVRPPRSPSSVSSAADTPAPAIAATSRAAIRAAPGRRFPGALTGAAAATGAGTGADTGVGAATGAAPGCVGPCGTAARGVGAGAAGACGAGLGVAGAAGADRVGVYGAAAASAQARSICSARSAPSRPAGSRSSSPRTTGSSGPHASGGRISSKTTACRIPPRESRRKGEVPLRAAHSRAPSDHRSASGPAGVCPDIRSGAVYSGEPTKDPVVVSVVAPDTWAMPKSVSTARPPGASRRTFAGLMSRCSTPAACAVRSAPTNAIPIRAASATSTGPVRESRSARDPPSTSSMTM